MDQQLYEHIAHSYDPDYYESLEGKVTAIQNKLSRTVYVSGQEHMEGLNTHDPDIGIIYIPSHRSHMDYLIMPKLFHDMGVKIPRILGGSNLLIPGLSKPFLGHSFIDFKRAGMVEIDRKRWKKEEHYRETHLQYIEDLLQGGEHLMFFPGGRLYDGMIKDLKIKVISPLFDMEKRKTFYVVPISLTYDRPFEDESFSTQQKINANPYLEKIKFAYLANIVNGIHTASFASRGDIYVDFKAPILIHTEMTQETLVGLLETEFKAGVRLTSTTLVARSVLENPSSSTRLESSIEELKDRLLPYIPFSEEVKELHPTQLVRRGVELLTRGRVRPALRATAQGVYSAVKPDLLRYYGNHIIHLL